MFMVFDVRRSTFNVGRVPRGLSLPALLLLAACVGTVPQADPQQRGVRGGRGVPPQLADSAGWGVHVLALARAPDGGLWAGTYGKGVFVLRPDTATWDRIAPSDDAGSIAAGHVNSIAFERGGAVWVGTAGSGFGRSLDGGRTWRNWTREQLGDRWQNVAPRGIATQGDTVYVATTDGLRVTWDGGERWRCVAPAAEGSPPSESSNDGCTENVAELPTSHLLALDVAPEGTVWVGHLEGVSTSTDGGGTWSHLDEDNIPHERVRAVAVVADTMSPAGRNVVRSLWVATETDIYVDSTAKGTFKKASIKLPGWQGLPGSPRAIIPSPGELLPALALSYGMAVGDESGGYRIYFLAAGDRYRPAADIWSGVWIGPPTWPLGGSAAGLNRILGGEASIEIPGQAPMADAPETPRHDWFGRPIQSDANPYADGTHRYGSTDGGELEPQRGAGFSNPAGTPVHAIGDGTVAFAGPTEQGSNTVAVLHDRRSNGHAIFSTYSHNSAIDVTVGQRVQQGDVIARAGSTGGARNNRVRLEVHVSPTDDVGAIVADAREDFPPHAVNPQLWVEPLPGTGVVAGQVVDSAGTPVYGAKVYGLVLPYPAEAPFSYAETYVDGVPSTTAYDEHFAVGDVPAGEYLLGVEIDGGRVWRRLRVAEGRVTFVVFSP